MILFGFWRSSCSWRVRIALRYKGIPFDNQPIHLQRNGGEQFTPAHRHRNPMKQVPVLQDQLGSHQMTISQSIAIMEYLEEQYPNPSILPTDAKQRFRARQVSEVINSGIQPLQNSSTLKAIEALGQDKKEWAKSWIQQGLDNLETMVRGFPETDFVVSSTPTMADFCLIPQLYNAKRFGCTMAHWTRLRSIQAKCMTLPAFVLSHPENQHDAPADTNPQNDPSHKN